MNKIIKYSFVCFLLLSAYQLQAQRKVSAQVDIKQVAQGKILSVKKNVYCRNDGRLVIHFTFPQEYFLITNSLGESKIYHPGSNEVVVDNQKTFISSDELIAIFLLRKTEDMGLKNIGYVLVSTEPEDGYLKKTFKSSDGKGAFSKIEVVYENYLPIYCGYYDNKDKIMRKSYYSNYLFKPQFVFPERVTEITYLAEKDSIVKREIYSDIKLDTEDTLFDFDVPSNAKVVKLPVKKK